MEDLNQMAKKGLLCMVLFVLMILVGTFTFSYLERSQAEIKNELKAKYEKMQIHALNTSNLSLVTFEAYADTRQKYLEFQGGLNTNEAFRLSLSISFTTGWGAYVPSTPESKVFFLFYSCISISIATVMLKSIGDIIHVLLLRLITVVEKKALGKQRVTYRYLKCSILSIALLLSFIILVSILIGEKLYSASFLDSVYGSFQAYSTIGFGDLGGEIYLAESAGAGIVICLLLIDMVGMSLLATMINSLAKLQESGFEKIQKRARQKALHRRDISSTKGSHFSQVINTERYGDIKSPSWKSTPGELGFNNLGHNITV